MYFADNPYQEVQNVLDATGSADVFFDQAFERMTQFDTKFLEDSEPS